MKKIIIIAILCISSAVASAQAIQLTVNNNTPCDVYYVLYGDILSNCSRTHRSVGMTLTAGSNITYSDPADPNIPGGLDDGLGNLLSSTDVFTMIRVYQGDPYIACMPTPIGIANLGGCGSTPTSASIRIYTNNAGSCAPCTSLINNVTWTMTSPSTAVVNIN